MTCVYTVASPGEEPQREALASRILEAGASREGDQAGAWSPVIEENGLTVENIHMESINIDSEISAFAAILQSAGTVNRAQQEKAYLKSELSFYGTAVPIIRKTAKTFAKAHPDLSHSDLISLVDALWTSDYHEMRSLGIALLDFYPHLLTAKDWEFLEILLRKMKTWAHVDWIAMGAIAQLIEREPSTKAALIPWSTDPSFWLRRTAMLALMDRARCDRDDFDRFAAMASPMIQEQEFFIRKAIGWILREVSKYQPEWTYEFLAQHIDQVSGLTLREGSKYLPTSQRESLLEQYKQRKSLSRVSIEHIIVTFIHG